MKVGIITLPFNWNYGGILQNYALQWALKNVGHEPLTLYRIDKVKLPLIYKLKLLAKRLILKIVFRKDISLRVWPNEEELKVITQNTDRFIRENIDTTEPVNSENELNKFEKYNFEAFVTGSDQVWRPKYSPTIENHFLGFLKKNQKIKRIAYAASFGTDKWEFSPKQTSRCAMLAKQFDAISVREDSGVKLCQDYFGVNPVVALDPTFLVPKEEYMRLVENDGIPQMPGTLFDYVLDSNVEKEQLIQGIAKKLNLVHFSSSANKSFFDVGRKQLNECIYPPVTHWLRAFIDAEFVVTDSFHGTVFSIIFNKPFIALGNAKRGLARFLSILNMFDLENRLLLEYEDSAVDELLSSEIDFNRVNRVLESQKAKSIRFLKESLDSRRESIN